MSYYIIIRGPLGIGKTTIAKELAMALGAKYISFDKVFEENDLDKIADDFTPEDFIKANEIVLPIIKQCLNEDRIVILDGCFYFKDQIEHLEISLPNKFYAFNLKAPLQTCILRDSRRLKSYGGEAARAVYNLVAKFDYGIDINTDNRTKKEVVAEIMEKLK
jgi:shikimate kinase